MNNFHYVPTSSMMSFWLRMFGLGHVLEQWVVWVSVVLEETLLHAEGSQKQI